MQIRTGFQRNGITQKAQKKDLRQWFKNKGFEQVSKTISSEDGEFL